MSLKPVAVVASLSLASAACTSVPAPSIENGSTVRGGVRVETPAHPLECVPYARAQSGVAIRGDAWTWWSQAAGRYVRAHSPHPGAVMVFSRDGGPAGGHVAVVRDQISAREIRVDHANWLGRGRIFLGDPVRDVSATNDWSLVNVWNADTENWGSHRYPISGFIEPRPAGIASAEPDD